MTTKVETRLDEELQIVRQRIDGDMDLSEFTALAKEAEACAQRLQDPDDVRILVDGRAIGRASLGARREIIRMFGRPALTAMAIWTPNRAARAILRMLMLLLGRKALRGFATEEEAIRWLESIPRRGA